MSLQVGVVLPNGFPGVDGKTVIEWARRIDAGPFSSIAVADRLVYHNLDPMMTLAAAAAVTSRARLVTHALLAPLRSAAHFAKDVATLTVLAPGRVTLGVGVGARPQDYEAAGVEWAQRGRILDDHLEALGRLRAPGASEQELGPRLSGDVEILMAGASPPALRRLVRFGHGYMSGGILPEFFGYEAQATVGAWKEAGRAGEPRLVGGVFFASSEQDPDRASAFLGSYMTVGGPPPPIRAPIYRGTGGVRALLADFEARGADEVLLSTAVPDLDELDWLAEVVAGVR